MPRPLALAGRAGHLIAFVGPLIIVALGVAVLIGVREVGDRRQLVGQSRDLLIVTSSLIHRATEAETGQRGYVLTGEPAYLAPYHGARADVAALSLRLRELLAGDSEGLAQADSLTRVLRARMTVLDDRIRIMEQFGHDSASAALAAGRGLELMEGARGLAASMQEARQRQLALHMKEEDRYAMVLLAVILLGSVVATFASIALNRKLLTFAAAQEAAAAELALQNERLQDQAVELETQQQQLQDDAVELEAQASELQAQAAELEAANEELEITTSELRHTLQVAELLRTDAEVANRAKSDFLAMMSHELRTPLNAITGYVELLEMGIRGSLTDAQCSDLNRIKLNSRHLMSLITDVLNFARLEAGELELHLESLQAPITIANLDSSIAPLIASARLRYEVVDDCSGSGTDARVLADAERVQQILLNLTTNAIKFTPAGGTIRVRCSADATHVSLSVSDTGRGIPGDKLRAIFEPFVQVDRHLHHRSDGGIGLGLAISRDLARRMGGDLTVSSEIGVGSVFTLRLPRLAEAPDALPTLMSASPRDRTLAS
jgi:signal transduction histidine kinase